MKRITMTGWCQDRIRQMTAIPERCIDATAGTGKDTLFLCSLLKEKGGELLVMDIQETAIDETKKRLLAAGYEEKAEKAYFRKAGEKYPVETNERPSRKTEPARPADAGEGTLLEDETGKTKILLVKDGHEHMERYFPENSVDVIMFNLGYLPGGDHSLATKPETTLVALKQALRLLKKDGVLSLLIYSGGDSGFEEKKQVLQWLKTLDARRYTVLAESFYNRPNHPPLPVFVQKMEESGNGRQDQ